MVVVIAEGATIGACSGQLRSSASARFLEDNRFKIAYPRTGCHRLAVWRELPIANGLPQITFRRLCTTPLQ